MSTDVKLKVIIGFLIVVLIYAFIGMGYNIIVEPSSVDADFLLK